MFIMSARPPEYIFYVLCLSFFIILQKQKHEMKYSITSHYIYYSLFCMIISFAYFFFIFLLHFVLFFLLFFFLLVYSVIPVDAVVVAAAATAFLLLFKRSCFVRKGQTLKIKRYYWGHVLYSCILYGKFDTQKCVKDKRWDLVKSKTSSSKLLVMFIFWYSVHAWKHKNIRKICTKNNLLYNFLFW